MSAFDASAVKKMEYFFPDDPTNPSSWTPPQLCILLIAIVQASNGILDSKYIQHQNLQELVNNPNLRETLVAAWNNQDYSEVLNTPFLRPESSVSLALPPEGGGLSYTQKRQLLFAMSQPYLGIAVDALYQHLEQNDRNFEGTGIHNGYYAKLCSVVQSSGTGKTRTILELGRKGVLLLYINLRPNADKTGFPLRDDVPAEILTGYCKSETEYHNQCCAFLGAIFKLVRDDLSARLKSHGAAAVESWNDDLRWQLHSSYRANFFERLKDAYNQIKKDIEHKLVSGCHADFLPQRLVKACSHVANSIEDTSKKAHALHFARNVAENEVLEYYDSMNELFLSVFPGGTATIHKPKLVIALDEAHTIHEVTSFKRSTVLFQVIHWYCVKARCRGAVWMLLASTTSKVADFAPPQAYIDSAGVPVQFPPYCELGWDQYAPPLGDVPPGDVAKAKHILKYGRPLWLSLQVVHCFGDIFELARQKLIALGAYDPTDKNQALAVLGQRFGLDICFGHRDFIQFVERSVASHLCVCIATTENPMWTYTAYPSEPFLSCVAAHSLHKNPAKLERMLNVLMGLVENGMIRIGQRGELVSRLLWLLAKDLFVIQKKGSRSPFAFDYGFDTELFHCSMIPVVEFFEFVFGKDFWSGRVGRVAKKAFKDAYVNFSHWISMESFIRPDDRKAVSLNEWTMRHWQRTCAIQCCHDQPSVDQVIPIYFKSVGRGDADCMSQILISDNTRADKRSNALSEIKRTDPTIGGKHQGSSKALPYIVIVADLGLDTPELEMTFPTESSARRTTESCLRIRACALSPETYSFLKDYPPVLQVLQQLVRWQDIPKSVMEHSRDQLKYGNSAEARYMEWERDSGPSSDRVSVEIS